MLLARYGYQSLTELMGRPLDDLERSVCMAILDDLIEQENLNSTPTTTNDD